MPQKRAKRSAGEKKGEKKGVMRRSQCGSFRGALSHAVAKMKEGGLIDKLSEQWWRFERRAQEGCVGR